MTADEFRAAIADYGLTQVECARWLDIAERTVRRWSTGEVAVPRSVQMLFAVMGEFDLTPGDISRITEA